MTHTSRFHTWMPEGAKKADLMFVQHMVASLKHNGRMAVVMPHGVLFRGGEERLCRQKFIEDGILEAVIGLPQGLFYGTGIPACVLVFNKNNAAQRKHLIFINADREYKEGKNQNKLRPEDIEKITHVYKALSAGNASEGSQGEVKKYARAVTIEELIAEEFNLNIRRYVDNSPPPEPQDVRAHLNGGVPNVEIESLAQHWQNYPSLREALFTARTENNVYSDFSSALHGKEQTAEQAKAQIKSIIESHLQLQDKHETFNQTLQTWWQQKFTPQFYRLGDKLTGSKGVFALREEALNSIVTTLLPKNLLSLYQIRGAMANNFKKQEADLKSIANSGWNAELIPDQKILQSQFPQVLASLKQDQTCINELDALFAAANENNDEETEPDNDNGVLPKQRATIRRAD